MVESEDRSYEAPDGSRLPMRVWRAAEGAGALVYLHGIQSHSGWYEASSRRLAEEAGVSVYQIERRGSGTDTAHERGHVTRAAVWLQDVAAAAEVARRETGARRVHLMGVSWGGKLALACARHRPDLYRSLILGAPGIIPQVDLPFGRKVRIGWCVAVGRALERFEVPLADPHLFTENPERIRYIAEDPLSLHEVTARFLFESRRLDRLARRAARSVRLPTLLVLAEHDRIIDNEATRALLAGMPADRLKIIVHRGGHHTLEFDPDPEGYFSGLVRWVRQVERSPGAQGFPESG
jgi:alpha-beta hydrolase superfamily lysophospholipase